jgi:hypothetical protein
MAGLHAGHLKQVDGPDQAVPRRQSIICQDPCESRMKLGIEPELQHHAAAGCT